MAAHSRLRTLPVILALGLILVGCVSSGPRTYGVHSGRVHYTVAPYQVNGVWYHPTVDYDYDTTGTASWYGPGFDHRATSDGEIYDMNELSAAHKTLPLPSVVEVTNLQNGRELRLRVNDRGPFIGDRLIDVSRRAAQLLGFESHGTAPVRVRVLKGESIEVAEAAMRGQVGGVMVAGAARLAPARLAASLPPQLAHPQLADAPLPPVPRIAEAPPPRPMPQIAEALAPPQPVPTAPAPLPAPITVATAPPPISPQPAAPPRMAAARRSYWPSLIAPAHAETLRPMAAFAARRDRIFVQAGAFAVPENAQRVRARIAVLGSAEVVRATVNGAALYRVRLGPVASEAAARRLLTRVVDSGYPGARLVGE
jgi:rare lipoprotein A